MHVTDLMMSWQSVTLMWRVVQATGAELEGRSLVVVQERLFELVGCTETYACLALKVRRGTPTVDRECCDVLQPHVSQLALNRALWLLGVF